MTLQEVANITGLTTAGVSKIEHRALRKMRRAFQREGYAVNLLHDSPKETKHKKVAVLDDKGNRFPSIIAAAAVHNCSPSTVVYRIRKGVWRAA
jgi:transcriptional regulator